MSAAELATIAIALDHADCHFHQTHIVLFSDSQRVLRAIQIGDVSGSKRMLLYRILKAIASSTKKNTNVRLKWVPAHEGIVGNGEADEAARAASSRKGKPLAPALERVREVEGVIRLINRDRSDDPTPFDSAGLAGQYTCKMDQALPGKHTLPTIRSFNVKSSSDPDPGKDRTLSTKPLPRQDWLSRKCNVRVRAR